MATIVRVKRRYDEDPLEILFLSHKKAKIEDEKTGERTSRFPADVLKFAGRVSSKDVGIAKPVREAIRKEKLKREYRQHQTNILCNVKQESRRRHKQHSQQSRFKITAKHRALELDLLDKAISEEIPDTEIGSDNSGATKGSKLMPYKSDSVAVESSEETEKNSSSITGVTDRETEVSSENKPAVNILCECKRSDSCTCKLYSNLDASPTDSKERMKKEFHGAEIKPKGKHKSCDQEVGIRDAERDKDAKALSQGANEEKMFCLVDVEAESPVTSSSLAAECNQILCNGVPLEREVVSEKGSHPYVYDLYYTNSSDFDFRLLENVLTVEAFGHDLRAPEEDSEDEGGGHEDEDSNDEGNWRNDYPDEDPGFIENQDVEYDENDLDENLAFETETGDELSDWLSWRCNIENDIELSSDDEIEAYERKGKSVDAYYRRVRREFAKDSDISDYDEDNDISSDETTEKL